MGQLPQQPLNYMAPNPAQPVRARRGVFGWVLFVGLAVMLFMLLSKRGGNYRSVPFSDFAQSLEEQRVRSITLDGDEITGVTADGQPFRTALPAGMGGNWNFVHWLIEKSSGTTRVEIRNADNVLVNILVPMIPWLLIFGFLWFLMSRTLRKTTHAPVTQIVVTGAGRWVPDEPGKAGQA
jgi:cell division protease FtsH